MIIATAVLRPTTAILLLNNITTVKAILLRPNIAILFLNNNNNMIIVKAIPPQLRRVRVFQPLLRKAIPMPATHLSLSPSTTRRVPATPTGLWLPTFLLSSEFVAICK